MTYRSPLCPTDPGHGQLLDYPTERWGFYCPHEDHMGRSEHNSRGPLPASRPFFTTAEATPNIPTPRRSRG